MGAMKILFICGSLEPGKDGVGDYTASLASELIGKGHQAMIVGLADGHVEHLIEAARTERGRSVPCRRIPKSESWEAKLASLRQAVDAFDPDWISFQFVPWTYQKKGCVFGLGAKLRAAIGSGRRVQVMFHELWIGASADDPPAQRIFGFVQKLSIRALLRTLRPDLCHTSNPVFLRRLSALEPGSRLLPLFGNIPIVDGSPAEALDLIAAHSGGAPGPGGRGDWILAGVFGTIHPAWDPADALADCLKHVGEGGKKLAIVLIGRNGSLKERLRERLRARFGDRLHWIEVGPQPASVLSQLFRILDFAFATSPLPLIGKSGSALAMLEHGVPLLVTRLAGAEAYEPGEIQAHLPGNIFVYKEGAFDWSAVSTAKSEPASKLPEVAGRFADHLATHES